MTYLGKKILELLRKALRGQEELLPYQRKRSELGMLMQVLFVPSEQETLRKNPQEEELSENLRSKEVRRADGETFPSWPCIYLLSPGREERFKRAS